MRTKLWLIATTVLTLALVGQLGLFNSHSHSLVLHASWANNPKSLKEARAMAQSIMLAEVVSVEQGEDLVVPVEGEPNGEDRVPTQRVTLKVIKAYKGGNKADDTVVLFQTGGLKVEAPAIDNGKELEQTAQQVILEGDPLYAAGEKYLLLLEAGPNGLQRTISPEGRYLQEANGKLKAMVDNAATREVAGKSAQALERVLAGAE